MVYAVYAHRQSPNLVIFDRDLANPPQGSADDYDCVGVFEADANAEFRSVDGCFVLCGPGSVTAEVILASKSKSVWTRD